MADAIRNAQRPLPELNRVTPNGAVENPKSNIQNPNTASFRELLEARQGLATPNGTPVNRSQVPATSGDLRFSAHAQTRLSSRSIALSEAQMGRLTGAVQRAQTKGAKDALVLLDDLALVVSVKNKTVVTVVDKDNLKQNVFTNIDSAVIA